jgi:RNA polymerase sigma factor (sigma-70 family)
LSRGNKKDINNENSDSNEIEDLYREYKSDIFNYLLIKTKNDKDVSKDILSETFCSFIEGAENLKNKKNIKSYLFQIANRRLNDFLRKKYHDKRYDEYFDVNEKMNDVMAEELHTKEQLLMVKLAMDNMSPLLREVLKLKYLEEKTQNEIAEIIKKTVSSVETLLVRARRQLRIELKKIKGFINEI